jgi:Mrp family chromosome partitioning ATPase
VADATEIAPMVDGVFMVYTVGKIGRGVLKRAKSSLENVDAKVLGVILNNVKPEAGPEYFKYHSGHYYGYEEAHERRSDEKKRWIARLRELPRGGKVVRTAAVLSALALMLAGIFWKDLLGLLP